MNKTRIFYGIITICVITFVLTFTGAAFSQEPILPQPSINWAEFLMQLPNLIIGLFSALIAICLFIPGQQPEKFLQSVVDFLSKFSRK